MTDRGLSVDRLARLHDAMTAHVERGDMPGLVTVVSRRGEVHTDVVGTTAFGGSDPMRRDSIFRMTSMTKPVTAAAAMILVEECRLRLDEPVDRLLPELADRRVLRRLDGPLDDTVPAHRPITLRDLLMFRLGFGQVPGAPATDPIQRAVAEQGTVALGPPTPATAHPPDEWLRRFATLPLMHQPGESWNYHTGAMVLGVLLARATGQPLEAFLRERLFEPLGMVDTGFSVPPAKLDRLVSCYRSDPGTGSPTLYDENADSHWSRPPAFPDAGAGLVSTADDYLAFALMLLNQGRHGDRRILSRPSVELMTTNHLSPAQQAAGRVFLGTNLGWGFGLSVVTRRNGLADTPGRYGWDGGYGTSWANDPTEGLVALLLTQRMLGPEAPLILDDFWTSVYQAIED